MDHHSSQSHFSRRRGLLQTSLSLGGSLSLFSVLVIFQGEFSFFFVIIIIIFIACVCLKANKFGEETETDADYAQSSDTPSSFDVERQAAPRSPSPQQKYPKLCPSCGGQLEEGIIKQLIITGRANCMQCGNQIQIK